jgi:hypothetical protein
MACSNGGPRWARGAVLIFTTLAMLWPLGAATSAAPVAATHSSGFLSICKQESGTGLEGIVFNFAVGRQVYSAPVGACSASFRVPTGRVTITELARTGSQLVGVSAVPAGRLAQRDLAHRTATVNVIGGDVSHETVVTFTNQIQPGHGFLKICKIAGARIAVGTSFTFSVGGETTSVTAGPAADGGYCVLVDSFPNGQLTVTERAASGVHVASITVEPTQRLVLRDVKTRTATVSIQSGITTVTYTNERNA